MEWIQRFGPPQLTWLVAALLVQRERQRWHHEVTRLLRDTGERTLPELAGWTVQHHGMGIRLTGPDGELLDADFHDETGAVIDPWFFAYRVESLSASPSSLVERRLCRWRPDTALIVDGLTELGALGGIHETEHGLVLAPELDARARAVTKELAARESWDRWLDALEPGGETAHVAQHRAWMYQRVRESPRPGALLDVALRDAPATIVRELCAPLLANPDASAGSAIQLLRTRHDVPVLREVAALLRRASLERDHPFAPFHACAYLIERDVERDLALERFDAWAALTHAPGYGGNPMGGEMAIFALQHLPERALRLARENLRSSTPGNVADVAAFLAAIDQPWCHRELFAAWADPAQESRALIGAAVRSTTSSVAHRRMELLERTHLPVATGTFADLIDDCADELVTLDAPQRELASALRATYPPDWDGSVSATSPKG